VFDNLLFFDSELTTASMKSAKHPTIETRIKVGSLLFLVALLNACGGGGDAATACSTQGTLAISASWNSNGSIDTRVAGKVGEALTATPTVLGIPASCQDKASFSGQTTLPAGLVLNKANGAIAGTPTVAISQGGDFVFLNLPGYAPIKVLGIINIAP
jgi:hypothetical protein